MKPSKLIISILVESYDEKTAETYRNYYVAGKRILSKLSKISILNLISQIDALNKSFVKNFNSLSLILSEK